MADAPVVHIGENSPEEVAFKLLHVIAKCESKKLYVDKDNSSQTADRKWILETYTECIEAVKGHRVRPGKWPSQSAP